jgi:hypothetical protein
MHSGVRSTPYRTACEARRTTARPTRPVTELTGNFFIFIFIFIFIANLTDVHVNEKQSCSC